MCKSVFGSTSKTPALENSFSVLVANIESPQNDIQLSYEAGELDAGP